MSLVRSVLGAANTLVNSATNKSYIEDVFSAYTYTGNSISGSQIINNGIDLAGKGGMVWEHSRSASGSNTCNLLSSSNWWTQVLYPHTPNAQGYANNIKSPSSTGYTTDSWPTGETRVGWTFRKAAKFFDIVTWTGDGTSNRTIPHNLGIAPGMIFYKATSTTGDWIVYHTSLGANMALILNSTIQQTAADTFNYTSPTALVFNAASAGNTAGVSYIAYLFAHNTSLDGLIQCGTTSTDSNGSATATLGWEPQYLLIKNPSTASDWYIWDTARGLSANSGSDEFKLSPNTTNAESVYGAVAVNSTGFTVAGGLGNSVQLVYMAIRKGPMRTPTSGSQVYNAVSRTGTGSQVVLTGIGFAPDLLFTQTRSGTGGYPYALDKLRSGSNYLNITGTEIEATNSQAVRSFDMNGVTYGSANGWNSSASDSYINWFFKRAPGFMDIVCYTGNNVYGRRVSHNLAAVPELYIVKPRSAPGDWISTFYSPSGGCFTLNSTSSTNCTTYGMLYDAGSATDFSLIDQNTPAVNYVAYLFATCPGVSKVFNYVGNGSSQTIPCGFSAGARFILIKRRDAASDWYIWDTTRGIISGNDPHLSLNTTSVEITTDNSIDLAAAGFIVNQNSSTNINVASGMYVGLAIA